MNSYIISSLNKILNFYVSWTPKTPRTIDQIHCHIRDIFHEDMIMLLIYITKKMSIFGCFDKILAFIKKCNEETRPENTQNDRIFHFEAHFLGIWP